MMTLAQRVRDQRYARGWGPDELASRASISRTALYQIESGRTEQPRASTLRRIAQALDIPTEALLGGHLGIVSLAWEEPQPPSAPRRDPEHASDLVRLRLEGAKSTVEPGELDRKFREVLASPFGEGVARIVEETHRFLPNASAGRVW